MKHIEDEFQALADAILDGQTAFTPAENLRISRFRLLWQERFAVKQRPMTDSVLNAMIPAEPPLTQEQQENLESKGYGFHVGHVLPGPQMAGLTIRAKMLALNRLGAVVPAWVVVNSPSVEFAVPDTFGNYGVVPLSPERCLVAGAPAGGTISAANAIEINGIAVAQSVQYFFARDLSKTAV